MPGKRRKSDLTMKSIWEEELVSNVLKNRRHRNKMWNWLIQHPAMDIKDIPFREWSIPNEASNILIQEYHKYTTTIASKKESIRGDTIKLLVRLQDGHEIETVVMKHLNHSTVCVSSQIGCQMGCRFCATGTMGIIGDLTSGEILEQLAHANSVTKIRNIVFMGMGEPLQNYENVKRAVLFMIDDQIYGLSPKQVTVSTVGVIKNMYRLSYDIPHINLALSLHAPNQSVRLKIVPTASTQKIDKLMEAVDYHIGKSKLAAVNKWTNEKKTVDDIIKPNDYTFTKRRKVTCVMIEYILIKDINDRSEHAHELGKLLLPRRDFILLNLIPYNPTNVAEDYYPPSKDDVTEFSRICQSDPYFLHTRVRHEMGQDIDGACGQLAISNNKGKMKSNTSPNQNYSIHDIEDTMMARMTTTKTNERDFLSSQSIVESKQVLTRESMIFAFGIISLPLLAIVLNLVRTKI